MTLSHQDTLAELTGSAAQPAEKDMKILQKFVT